MAPLLSIQNLGIGFHTETGLTPGVQGIHLDVHPGEIVALVGESGSGKSITALSILQLLPAPPAQYTSGQILFAPAGAPPIDLLRQSPKEMQRIRGNRIAMIFQEPMTSLNPVFTCGHQVMESLRLHRRMRKARARQQTLDLFEKVRLPNPAQVFDRYPHQLSGGQKQRVMIAMAMSCQPALLICDEPTTALDVTVQQTILQLIRELRQAENMGVIFITHDLGVVAEIANRVAVMYKGSIVEQGPVKTILQHPQHPYTKGLLACRPALHPRGERLPVVSDFLEGRREALPPGHPDKKLPAASPTPLPSEPFLQVRHLRVWYPARKNFLGQALDYTKAVDDVSFDVYRGETLGLVGESGCGKTTLGRALLRLAEPRGGSILLEGSDLLQYPAARLRRLRKDLQIVFQDPYSSLNPRISIGQAIEEGLYVHHMLPTARQRKERVVELLEKVSLRPEHYHRYPHEFSGGQRQRIVIARALALQPSFLVCDESVSALDVSVQAQVLNLLNDLKKEFGFTIVFISHDLSVIHYISHRIMVMQKGRIVETGSAEQVYQHPKEAYTRQLIASIPKGS